MDRPNLGNVPAVQWKIDDNMFTIGAQPILPLTRAWDRVPKSPSKPHQKGHKIWKRPAEPSVKELDEQAGRQLQYELASDAASHAVKRQCLIHMPAVPVQSQTQPQYAATMHDSISEPPKRKAVQRKSKRQSVKATTSPVKSRSPKKVFMISAVQEAAGVRELVRDESPIPGATEASEVSSVASPKATPEATPEVTPEVTPEATPEAEAVSLCSKHNDAASPTQSQSQEQTSLALEEQRVQQYRVENQAVEKLFVSSDVPVPEPSSGTERLALESSPALERCPTESESSSAEHSPSSKRISESASPLLEPHNDAEPDPATNLVEALTEVSKELGVAPINSRILSSTTYGFLASPPRAADKVNATPPIDLSLSRTEYNVNDTTDINIDSVEREGDQAKNGRAEDEEGDSSADELLESSTRDQDINSPNKRTTGSARKTRTSPRLSDDTNLLKDFLHRYQARAAAKSSEVTGHSPTPSTPRRSPRSREILGSLDSNSPSSTKPQSPTRRPDTPPGKAAPESVSGDDEDADELSTETTASVRRSGRSRIPGPSRPRLGAPSSIPFRRADGADALAMPKSEAQRLAIMTRTNTRRNKGQAKLPRSTLEALAAETAAPPDEVLVPADAGYRPSSDRKTVVGWHQDLVRFHEAEPARPEERPERRVLLRRIRGLGVTNGTPAPKTRLAGGAPGARERGEPATPRRRSKRAL